MESQRSDIEVYNNHPEYIRQTVQQLMKDFAMFGIEIEFSGNTDLAYHEMFLQTRDHIGELLRNNNQKLYALLYQIDLSNAAILKASEEHPELTLPEVITELVIHRELKKIILRNHIRQHGI